MKRPQARWYGLELVVADRWYPSSKTCSGCGHVNTSLGLGERTYRCAPCGLHLDRDVNAAVNQDGPALDQLGAFAERRERTGMLLQ